MPELHSQGKRVGRHHTHFARCLHCQQGSYLKLRTQFLGKVCAIAKERLAASIIVGLNWDHLRRRWRPGLSGHRIESLAVLPLHNLSHDPEQEYFSDGMTDQLITDLAKFGGLRVISHTSVERYKGTQQPLPEIARELGVDAVVEGTVTRSGDRVSITAQLIDARTDAHLWAETYQRDMRDVLVLQDELSRDIAEEVRIKLTPEERSRVSATGPSIRGLRCLPARPPPVAAKKSRRNCECNQLFPASRT